MATVHPLSVISFYSLKFHSLCDYLLLFLELISTPVAFPESLSVVLNPRYCLRRVGFNPTRLARRMKPVSRIRSLVKIIQPLRRSTLLACLDLIHFGISFVRFLKSICLTTS